MTPEEARLVSAAAGSMQFPVVHCRIGRVAEFTSKVVRCLVTAHAYGMVLPSVRRALAERGSSGSKRAGEVCVDAPLKLCVVAEVPLSASDLSVDLAVRPRMLDVVRLCVCALWRSGLGDALSSSRREGASASPARPPVSTALRVVFADGVCLALSERLVAQLSGEHRAAPTELQVLEALLQAVGRRRAQPRRGGGGAGAPKARGPTAFGRAVRRAARAGGAASTAALIVLEDPSLPHLPALGASLSLTATGKGPPSRLLLLLPLAHSKAPSAEVASSTAANGAVATSGGKRNALERACRSFGIDVVRASLNGCSAASIVTFIQFMHYCGKLLSTCQSSSDEPVRQAPARGRKRKR
mmetsp:Transcript_61362/g.193328  ORF Transcript_61362/g.193328 Transcript_61362/m.193328 type:complete len:356 (+) Transcript_61362:1-1068(+)